MYFWKLTPLKQELREKGLSQREQLGYLVAHVMVNSLGSLSFAPPGRIAVAGSAVALVVYIGGLTYAYRRNGGNEGRDFLAKVLSLGWVIQIQMIAWFLTILIPLNLLIGLLSAGTPDRTGCQIVGVIVALALYLIAFRRLGRHIAETRQDFAPAV